ncbi:hypothetical protein DL96DRAFT_1613538, partial [Flagelloscypha sp. PMI_526]
WMIALRMALMSRSASSALLTVLEASIASGLLVEVENVWWELTQRGTKRNREPCGMRELPIDNCATRVRLVRH